MSQIEFKEGWPDLIQALVFATLHIQNVGSLELIRGRRGQDV